MQRTSLPDPWCEQIVLDDGRRLLLRPIEPGDAEPLRAGFSLLTHEEVRMRFLHPMKELTPALAQQLTTLDRRRDFALVIAEPGPAGESLVGAVARASIDPVGRRAEFAIIVSRFLAGQGLGRMLMKKLVRWARLKRLDELYGDVLDENTAMLTLARALGFHAEVHPHERGLVRVRLDLRARRRQAR